MGVGGRTHTSSVPSPLFSWNSSPSVRTAAPLCLLPHPAERGSGGGKEGDGPKMGDGEESLSACPGEGLLGPKEQPALPLWSRTPGGRDITCHPRLSAGRGRHREVETPGAGVPAQPFPISQWEQWEHSL